MISKISFSKLTRSELHRLTWLTAVQSVVFALLIPFRVLVVLASQHNEGSFFSTADVGTIESFNRNVGLGHLENTVFILAAGALCALCAFHYIHSQVQLDFMHSLPVRRERLFGAKMLGSVLTFVLAYGASQFLAMVVGAFNGALTARAAYEIVLASVEGLLFFLCSYAATLLMMMLAGKILTSVLAVGVFAGYVPLLWVIWLMLRELFFTSVLNGYYSGTDSNVLFYSSPWAICLSAPVLRGTQTQGVTGYLPDIGEFCQLLALAAAMTAAALLLYRVRRTEAAGSALAFRRTEGVVKLLLTIPAALVAAVVAYAIFDSVVWVVVFVLVFGALGCMIMEFIYRWDIRQVLSHKSHMAITIFAALAVFLCLRYDVTGYNTYLPKQEELEAISVTGNPGWDYGFPGESSRMTLDFLETDQIGLVYGLAEDGVAHCGIDTYPDGLSYVSVKYREKSGRETYRSYWVDRELYYETMDALLEDSDYRSRFYPIMGWEDSKQFVSLQCALSGQTLEAWDLPDDWEIDENVSLESEGAMEEEGIVYYYDGTEHYEETPAAGEDTMLEFWLPASRAREVIEAYRKDLAQVPYSELAEAPGWLLFRDQNNDYERYRISENCKNVLGVLKEIIVQ